MCVRVCAVTLICAFCNRTKLILSNLCYLLSERLFFSFSFKVDVVHCTAHIVHISSSKCNKNKTKNSNSSSSSNKRAKSWQSQWCTQITHLQQIEDFHQNAENLKQEQNTHAQTNNAKWKRTKMTLNSTTGCKLPTVNHTTCVFFKFRSDIFSQTPSLSMSTSLLFDSFSVVLTSNDGGC